MKDLKTIGVMIRMKILIMEMIGQFSNSIMKMKRHHKMKREKMKVDVAFTILFFDLNE